MNKERRKELSEICKELETVNSTIDDIDYRIEYEMDAENYGFNNLSEGLQATMRGQAMENAVDAMDDARRALKRAKKEIKEVQKEQKRGIAMIKEASKIICFLIVIVN